MKVLVTIPSHFVSFGSKVFSHHLTYGRFWKRYLDAFDSVLVVGRSKQVEKVPHDWDEATGPGVEFCTVPDYHGPWQYALVRRKVVSVIREAVTRSNAFVLRVPSALGTLVWKNLPEGAPFGVEVVIDPWELFARGSVKSMGRLYFRWSLTHDVKKQCRQAMAVSYVTEYALQRRYPHSKGAFATHYSSIDLDSNILITDPSERLGKIKTIPNRVAGNGPAVRLGFIGSFSQGYKLPDVHIKALARCVAKGANVSLEMIGDGALLPKMKLLAQKLGVGDRVIFRGRLPGGKPIIDAIDSFDLFLNATASEGLPRVVIEAMSRGCPCIASDVCGTNELLERDYLVPLYDANSLAEKILGVLARPGAMSDAIKRNVTEAATYCRDVLQPRRQAFYLALRERTEKYLSLNA